MNTYIGPRGVVDLDGHASYMQAIDQEDEKLDRTLADIRRRTDAGQLPIHEAAIERVSALESHLAECQSLRRLYLGGS